MTSTLAIAENVTTLAEAESKFKLSPAKDSQFFTEWFDQLPELSEAETSRLDLIKQRFHYHRKYGHLAEGAINFVVLSALLEMAGFYDPPFLLRSEVSVRFAIEEQNETLKGRIDALVVQEQFWLLLVESKQTAFSIDVTIPQALAYLMGNPQPQRPGFGLVSNGGYFMFLKVAIQREAQYALSSDFSLYRQSNELCTVLSVLKQLAQIMRVS